MSLVVLSHCLQPCIFGCSPVFLSGWGCYLYRDTSKSVHPIPPGQDIQKVLLSAGMQILALANELCSSHSPPCRGMSFSST